jgi:hypothetical protein
VHHQVSATSAMATTPPATANGSRIVRRTGAVRRLRRVDQLRRQLRRCLIPRTVRSSIAKRFDREPRNLGSIERAGGGCADALSSARLSPFTLCSPIIMSRRMTQHNIGR